MDDLAEFYTREFRVRRYLGRNSSGPVYGDAETIRGRVRYGAKLIRNIKGEEVISQARITMPLDTARIPVDSLTAVVPDTGVWRTVIAEERHDAGPDMPNHYTINLT